MRQCMNCKHAQVDIHRQWYCEILHAEVFLNDDGCIYHDYGRNFEID